MIKNGKPEGVRVEEDGKTDSLEDLGSDSDADGVKGTLLSDGLDEDL